MPPAFDLSAGTMAQSWTRQTLTTPQSPDLPAQHPALDPRPCKLAGSTAQQWWEGFLDVAQDCARAPPTHIQARPHQRWGALYSQTMAAVPSQPSGFVAQRAL
eukprot:5808765-Amphidinium_carterae.1